MSKILFSFFLTISIAFLSIAPSNAFLPAIDSQEKELPTLAPLVKKVTPAIVNVATRTMQRVDNPLFNDPFFRDFFDFPQGSNPKERQVQGAGSGVIIDANEGIVITNHHVVDKASEIQIVLHDGNTLEAELLGSDPEVDIAVLRIDSINLEQLVIADSDNVEPGDFSIAIGNPFGLGHTVTTGIVSATGRSGLGIQRYENFIQTDASINPGNSGGALINLKGELIGINTAIIGPGGGNVGIGFAIPTNMAMASVQQILEFGEVKRGKLGITIQNITSELQKALDLPKGTNGVLIAQVESDSSAEEAGLQVGDVIISANNKPLNSASQLRNAIGLLREGDQVSLEIVRDGKSQTVSVTVGKTSLLGKIQKLGRDLEKKLEGVSLANTNDDSGVRVIDLNQSSKAMTAGLRVGDLIVEANRKKVKNLDDFRDAIKTSNDSLLLLIERGQSALFLVIN